MLQKGKRILSLILTIVIIFCTISISGYAQIDPLYYKSKLRTVEASKLLKNKKLTSSYIVVLDSGIQQDYYNKFYGKFIAGSRYNSSWGLYHRNPWTSYLVGTNHGTEVQWTIDEIVYETQINNPKPNVMKPNVMTIQYKICDADGSGNLDRLVYAINDVVNYYVKQKHMNIAAINYSSGITWKKGTPASIINNDKKKLQTAIDNAAKYGITFVTCSGNDNKQVFEYPALSNNVIVVGGTNAQNNRFYKVINNRKYGSCYGSQVDISAPAQDVLVYESDFYGRIVNSGTSYSTPMVSAAVGILKSINPKLKPSQIESILKSTATDIGAKGRDNYYGYGLLNIEKAVKYGLTH